MRQPEDGKFSRRTTKQRGQNVYPNERKADDEHGFERQNESPNKEMNAFPEMIVRSLLSGGSLTAKEADGFITVEMTWGISSGVIWGKGKTFDIAIRRLEEALADDAAQETIDGGNV